MKHRLLFAASVYFLFACASFVHPWLANPAAAQDAIVRMIEFRDGTLLRMTGNDIEIPWKRITPDGRVDDAPFNLSEIAELNFAEKTITERLLQTSQWIEELSDDDYFVRQRAQELLISRGALFQPIIEKAQQRAHRENGEPDFLWRIDEVLRSLPPSPDLARFYDMHLTENNPEEARGDAGDWSIEMAYHGETLSLNRGNISQIRIVGDEVVTIDAPLIGGWRRIYEDEDEQFPENVIRIPFERGGNGRRLSPGADISRKFVEQGFTLETSIEDTFVSVERYNVRGRSGGMSIATHNPMYEGAITVRFCKPGNARIAAGVHYVGLWTAYIVKEGTALEAYDATGRPLAIIKTQNNARDFLAIKSAVPIAYIKIVPDIAIDPNYAIDDLVFDPPVPLNDSLDDLQFTLHLSTGESIKAERYEVAGDKVVLHNISVGWEELELDRSTIAGFFPPYSGWEIEANEEDCFVLLRNGSTLRGISTEEGITISREGIQVLIPKEDIIACWGSRTYFEEPLEEAWPDEEAGLLLQEKGDPIVLASWEMGKEWIDSEELAELEYTYHNSPVIWLERPEQGEEEGGMVRLTNGEEYAITPDAFQIKEWTAENIVLQYQEQETTIPLGEIASIIFPKE